MTHTGRRRFPILFAALAALALAGAVLALLFSPVQAQNADEEPDTITPVFESARTDGDYVIVTFSEDIVTSAAVTSAVEELDVPVYQFFKAVMDVTVDGDNDVLQDNSYLSGNELWLQLSLPVSSDQTIRVAYNNIFAVAGDGILVDAAGNAVPLFSNQTVQNNAAEWDVPDRAPTFALSTTEMTITEGNSDTYTVSLVSQPSEDEDVVVNVSASRTVTSRPSNLTFTSENWDTPQTVTVTPVEDADSLDAWGIVLHYDDGNASVYWQQVRILVEDPDIGGL